jgi:hypothetical protein
MRQKKDLRPYQDRIARALYEHDERLCVVRPGGGKTIAALTAIEELIRDKAIRHALVIAPKRVANSVWPDEIALWEHTLGLDYVVMNGSPLARSADLMTANQRDVSIIGIDLVGWLTEQLEKYPDDSPLFDLLVIDEVSKFRDPTGKRVKALVKLASRWKMVWGLSGTLRPNSAQDLFMPARVVTRGKLWGNSFYAWQKKHFYLPDRYSYEWKPFSGTEDQLNADIAPWIVTLADAELPQLPALSVLIDRVELPPAARKSYDEMDRRLATGEVIAASAAVATGKLAQIANGFLYDSEDGSKVPSIKIHDEKEQWLRDLIDEAAGPTLLIYEFREDLRLIRSLLGNDVAYIGPGAAGFHAANIIGDWNAGRLPFLVLHPASGGHGLNLQQGGADMAWISPTWSPELWEQTIARLHRSGQTRPVMVRVCVATNTVDEMKLDRVHHKMSAQEAFEAYLRARQTRNQAA